MVKKVAVVFYSGYGHTEVVAQQVLNGLSGVSGIDAQIFKTSFFTDNPDNLSKLSEFDCIVFGSPTYMGSVAADFKKFMDISSSVWFGQGWKDKFAAGFTNSAGLSGDKLNTLSTLSIFAAQHSMIWISQGIFPKSHGESDVNRLGSWLGLMTQSENADASVTPGLGDREYAMLFGKRIGTFLVEKTK